MRPGTTLRGLLTTLAGTALAVTTVLALAAPVSADTETVDDRRGDTIDSGARGLNPPPAKRADILRVVGEHERGRVTLRFRMAAVGPGSISVQGRIRTDETTYTLSAFRDNGVLERAVIQDDVGEVPCAGFRVAFQPRRDTISLSAPRPCLSLPTWVRFGAWVNAWEDGVYRADDARRAGNGNQAIKIGQRRLRHN